MPRNRVRKTNIGLHKEADMRAALQMISEGQTIRAVAKSTKIPFTTLYRYNKKIKSSSSQDPINTESMTPNYSVRKIFNDAQEQDLVNYLTKCSKMFYGLTLMDTRRLAYEMAVRNELTVPQKWHETKLAGIEWLHSFRKRHPNISLRMPEGCSLSRATAFNRHNVNTFFNNLQEAMSRHEKFGDGTRVYNLDETNTMTVQKSAKVLAVKGQKQVSKVTSAERGTLVTTCYIINALGYALPPIMVFPRVHFKSHMTSDAPAGTLGLATQSGWMNGELFVDVIQHFITHTNSSKDNPSLLILDNHESHMSIQSLNLAKDHGVTILTVPPHSTGKLQPLDVGVFGPFKVAYNKAVDSWMMRNPGKTFSIYDVAGCVKEAHMKTMTPGNICSAFRATGIFPYNKDIFTDDDFAPSEVTDRQPETNNENQHPENTTVIKNNTVNRNISETPTLTPLDKISTVEASTSTEKLANNECNITPLHAQSPLRQVQQPPEQPKVTNAVHVSSVSAENIDNTLIQAFTPSKQIIPESEPSTSQDNNVTNKPFIGPFDFRGLPKAKPRKAGTTRRKGKSMIATDTPNKDEIEQRSLEKNKRTNKTVAAKTTKRKILESSSDDDEVQVSIHSEEEPAFDEDDDETFVVDPKLFQPLKTLPKEGNFILVEFTVRAKKIYYIGKVIGDKNVLEVSFLRKSAKQENSFHLPNIPDISTVIQKDIKMILPQPRFTGSTKRAQGLYHFDIDFTNIDLR